MSYYHYTKGCHLPSIVRDGIIKTTNCGCEKREKPAVWLTKSSVWEHACNIGHVLNHDALESGKVYSSAEIQTVTADNDYMKKEIGMCRIVISETLPTISFAKFRHVSRISEKGYNMLDNYSRSIGCPVDKWLCTFNPIPEKYWEAVEMFVEDQWVKWDGKMPIRKFVDLCLSCNSYKKSEELAKKCEHPDFVYQQVDFIEKHKSEIIDFWEANKHRKGYVEIYVTPDYKPYNCGFRFIERRIKNKSFKPLQKSDAENHALVHFLWEATYTQYKVAIPYEPAMNLK